MPISSRTDQAEGLRQMFAHTRVCFVPVVSNPHVAFGGVLLERLCMAFGERGRSVLVVDAGERANEAGEMAMIDLAQCVEPLGERTHYLAARGLPIRFVDAAGSTRSFLQRVAEAAPACDVILVHAGAGELARLFAPSRDRLGAGAVELPCAIVLADDRPASVTHAYASMKLLAARAGLLVSDLLLSAAEHSPRADRIAKMLAACADDFFGAVLRDWARVDPTVDPSDVPSAALRRLVADRLGPPPPARPATFSHLTRTFGATAEYATP